MIRRPAPLPKKRCMSGDSASFGYGDIEYHQCQEPATHRGFDTFYGRYRVIVCARHAKDSLQGGPNPVRFYRFRRVA